MLSRRSFLGLLGALPLARYLPRLPAAPAVAALDIAAINQVTAATVLPAVEDAFFRATPVLALLKSKFNSREPVRFRGCAIEAVDYRPLGD